MKGYSVALLSHSLGLSLSGKHQILSRAVFSKKFCSETIQEAESGKMNGVEGAMPYNGADFQT